MNIKNIVFRHTPKCAGTYIWTCLKSVGPYLSLGPHSAYKTRCSSEVIKYFNITHKSEVGLVESNITSTDHPIPVVIRAHESLNNIDKHTQNTMLVISNTRNPVDKFYSEFYHHQQISNGKLQWSQLLGDNIDNFIDEKLTAWGNHYVNTLNECIQSAHIVIDQSLVSSQLEQINTIYGLNIRPLGRGRINTCPVDYKTKYNYRRERVSQILLPALEHWKQYTSSLNIT